MFGCECRHDQRLVGVSGVTIVVVVIVVVTRVVVVVVEIVGEWER